jgi:hypothetical protein
MAQERDSGVSSDVMRARLKATEAAQTEPDPGIHDLMESTITAIYGFLDIARIRSPRPLLTSAKHLRTSGLSNHRDFLCCAP